MAWSHDCCGRKMRRFNPTKTVWTKLRRISFRKTKKDGLLSKNREWMLGSKKINQPTSKHVCLSGMAITSKIIHIASVFFSVVSSGIIKLWPLWKASLGKEHYWATLRSLPFSSWCFSSEEVHTTQPSVYPNTENHYEVLAFLFLVTKLKCTSALNILKEKSSRVHVKHFETGKDSLKRAWI